MASAAAADQLQRQQMETLQRQIQDALLLDGSDSSQREIAELSRRLLHQAQHPDAPHADGAIDSQQPSQASQLALRSLLAPGDTALVPVHSVTNIQSQLQRAFETTHELRSQQPNTMVATHRGWPAPPAQLSHSSLTHHPSLEFDREAQSQVAAVNNQLDCLHDSLRTFRRARMTQAVEFRQLAPAAIPVAPILHSAAHQRQLPPPQPQSFPATYAAYLPAPSRASISVIHSPRAAAPSQPQYSQLQQSFSGAAASQPWHQQQPQSQSDATPSAASQAGLASTLEQQLLQWQWQQEQQQQQSSLPFSHARVNPASSASAYASHSVTRTGTPPALATAADSGAQHQRPLAGAYHPSAFAPTGGSSFFPADGDWRSAPSSAHRQDAPPHLAAPAFAQPHLAAEQQMSLQDLLQSHSHARSLYAQ